MPDTKLIQNWVQKETTQAVEVMAVYAGETRV